MSCIYFRFDFVLNANQHVKFENKRGRHGTYYKHNKGVFKMRFQGLQACALDGVIGEALLVYNKFGSHRQDSEIELAEVFEHSSKRPHSSKSYERVIINIMNFCTLELRAIMCEVVSEIYKCIYLFAVYSREG